MDSLEPTLLVSLTGSVNWTVGFLTTVAIFAIVALALNLQWGYTGIFNFGVVGFFMVGAYATALLTLPPPGQFESHIWGLGLPVPVGWLAAAAAGGLLALVIGLPTLRLQQDFLAIATIGVAAILRSIANSTDGFVNRGSGLHGIPRFLDDLTASVDYRWVMLVIMLVTLALVYGALRMALSAPWGRVLRAVRDNEQTAMAAGKQTVSFRIQAFVLGGAVMGLAGALWAHRTGSISPAAFNDLSGTFVIWTMVMVGGAGNSRGVVLGALVVGFFWFGTPLVQEDLPDFLGTRVFQLREFAIGFLIVSFLLFRPRGLLPEEVRVSRFVREHPDRETGRHGATGATGPPSRSFRRGAEN